MGSIKENYKFNRYEYNLLGKNVFEASMERIGIIHDLFDDIVISFSGGKDSLVCLKLFELYRIAHNIKDKLKVLFYDEELVDSEVLKFVKKFYDSKKYDFYWICTPLESEKFILGKKERYIQWDPNRPHVREIPEWGLKFDGVRYQDKAHEVVTNNMTGKVANIVGLRADESMNRRMGIFATKNVYPFMNSEERNVTMCKPIYDWSEKDIFKFMYDYGIEYAHSYDNQIFNGDRLRVSTPLHAEASRTALLSMKSRDPILYDQVCAVFPEVELQVRYYGDIKASTFDYSKYQKSWNGVIKFVRDVVSDELQEDVVGKVMYAKSYRDKNIDKRP